MGAQYEIIIGNGGQQPFIIPGNCRSVSHEHARFWVDDAGNWWIEDIKGASGNGTFVMGEDGVFRSIKQKMIDRDTIIRLGQGGHNSFTFYANRILAPEDYSYEFDLLEGKLRAIKQEQAMLEAENEKKQKRMKQIRIGGSVLTLGVAGLGLMLSGGNPLGFTPALLTGAITGLLPSPDTKQLKALEQRKRNILLCPKCFNPIGEAFVNNRQCPACKAKG